MKPLTLVLSSIVLGAAALAAAGYYAAKAVLAPLPGEWSAPLQWGPIRIEAGVPSLIRLATSPWGGPLLDGRKFDTANGPIRLGWQTATRTLSLRCSPCSLRPPGLGAEGISVSELQVSVRRQGEALSGDFVAGQVHGSWRGDLAPGQLQLRATVPWTSLADGYALFANQIPEVNQASIGGKFSLQAKINLPSGAMQAAVHVDGFEVAGLGTEALAGARTSCARGQRASRLAPESWLARATIAAEDQRFYEHPGYDLAELNAALSSNQQAHRIERGASTLSQQLAKLLVTGDERSPMRKMRELLYAVEMERTLGKARILRLYLDNAPWGQNLCGAEAASQYYFAVRAHELTAAQASWLAAMLRNPTAEAQHWAETGQINVARAQWVALALRGMSRKQKLALAQDMAEMAWPPLWAEPVTARSGSSTD
jgi:hypothetical protein